MDEEEEDFNVTVLKRQYEEVKKKAIPGQWLDDNKGGEKEKKINVSLKCKDTMVNFNLGSVKMFYVFL